MAITKISNSGFGSAMTKYDSLLAGNPYFQPTSYESIQTYTVGSGGQSTITFSSIPSTYTHLQIRGIARSMESASSFATLRMTINGATSYAVHSIGGNGTTAAADGGTSSVLWAGYEFPKDATTANVYGATIIDILDYANTNKYKTIRVLEGVDLNGSGNVHLDSGLYPSTSAISSISLYFNVYNLKQYSQFALYGVK